MLATKTEQPEWVGEKTLFRTIRIRITDTCNFNCSYCVEHDTPNTPKHMGQYDMISMLENLKALYIKDSREQRLFIWGGEPTLNINLLWFIKMVRNYYTFITDIEIHSNLSQVYPAIFFEHLVQYNVKVSSSIHIENKTIKSKNPINNMYKLKDLNLLNEVNLMLHGVNDYTLCTEIKSKFHLLPISIVPTFQLLDSTNYKKIRLLFSSIGQWKDKPIPSSDEDLNYIQVRNGINLKGYYCNVPMDSFIINTDGVVYLCQNDFIEKVSTKINFFVPNINLDSFLANTVCNYTKCDCEHIILKRKNI